MKNKKTIIKALKWAKSSAMFSAHFSSKEVKEIEKSILDISQEVEPVEIFFSGNIASGSMNLSTTKMICIPSKPKYSEVSLCLKELPNDAPFTIGYVESSALSFDERIKLGFEIARRWNNE